MEPDVNMTLILFPDGAQKPGSGVRSHSGEDIRGQYDRYGHPHAWSLQNSGDAYPARKNQHLLLQYKKTVHCFFGGGLLCVSWRH